jgi:hypothetical protein
MKKLVVVFGGGRALIPSFICGAKAPSTPAHTRVNVKPLGNPLQIEIKSMKTKHAP